MWDIVSSVAAWGSLIFFVLACIFAISVNDNRLDEVRFIEQFLQRNAQKLASLGRAAIDPKFVASDPKVGQYFDELLEQASHYERKAQSLNYARTYGASTACLKIDWGEDQKTTHAKPNTEAASATGTMSNAEATPSAKEEPHKEGFKVRLADYFHANSDTTNVMIIGMSACRSLFQLRSCLLQQNCRFTTLRLFF